MKHENRKYIRPLSSVSRVSKAKKVVNNIGLGIVIINAIFYPSAKYRTLAALPLTQVIGLKSHHFALWGVQ